MKWVKKFLSLFIKKAEEGAVIENGISYIWIDTPVFFRGVFDYAYKAIFLMIPIFGKKYLFCLRYSCYEERETGRIRRTYKYNFKII